MNMKELLGKAAIAAGIDIEPGTVTKLRGKLQAWRPDEDDGDSARLADALMINIINDDRWVGATHRTGIGHREFLIDHPDRAAARRMAVLRLAASMGDGLYTGRRR